MKVCDVVLNSVWYDPRVRKQIIEYKRNKIKVVAVGLKCARYNEEKIKALPFETEVITIDERFDGKQKGIIRKLKREMLRIKGVRDAIIAHKPDVIHANDLNALIPSYLARKKLKCKLIYDSHEINTQNNNMQKFKVLPFIMEVIEKHLVKKVDEMVCVSHAAAEYFEKQYKIKKPMVITNCCLKSECCISEKKNQGFEILNHGQYYAGRGYDVMIESIPFLKEYPEIKIALRGFGNMENELRKRAEEIGSENIRFYPPVPVEQLISEAGGSKVGVAITVPICLNFKLSVSNKLFEYAAAGLPVIMSDIPEHRYLNEKYHFGIILEQNTPECFAQAAIKLYTDNEFYELCVQNAKKLSEDVNWENEFSKIIEFINNRQVSANA